MLNMCFMTQKTDNVLSKISHLTVNICVISKHFFLPIPLQDRQHDVAPAKAIQNYFEIMTLINTGENNPYAVGNFEKPITLTNQNHKHKKKQLRLSNKFKSRFIRF